MNDVLWTLSGVELSGQDRPRLSDIEVEITRGITAVLGPSGSGKTSLLNLLVGYERADKGRVSRSIGGESHTLPVYWVPQSGGLWPHLTVREHLVRVLPKDAGAGEIEKMVEAFDLGHRLERHPDELSEGERSRLAVARALLADAAAVVMDEPLAHVDTMQSTNYWEAVRKHFGKSGSSLVFATHSPKTVLAQAERVICIRDGALLYRGEVRQLYWEPPTRELGECLGEVNWFEPEEARLWLGRDEKRALALRPEQLAVEPAPGSGGLIVRESRFKGDVAEVELTHPPSGKSRTVFHRPARDGLGRGISVILKVLVLLMAACVFSGCGHGGDPTLVAKDLRLWSMPPDGDMIPAPRSVAMGVNDEVVVVDNRGRVLIFDKSANLKREWRMSETAVGKPEGVCVLRDGIIVVSDTHYHRVVCFDGNGKVVREFGREGRGPGEFIYPVAVERDGKDNIFVAEYGSNDRVQKFTSEGVYVLSFGSFGTEPGQFQRPSGLAWRDGKVYVADAVNNRIQIFSDDGKFLGQLGQPEHPLSLDAPYGISAVSDGTFCIVEYGASRVTRVDGNGRVLGRFGTPGSERGQLRNPWGMTVDSSMRVRVADTGNRRLVELGL